MLHLDVFLRLSCKRAGDPARSLRNPRAMGKKGGKKKALDPEAAARQAAAENEEKKRMEMIREAKRLRENCEREEILVLSCMEVAWAT
eukprot:s301_g5.t1